MTASPSVSKAGDPRAIAGPRPLLSCSRRPRTAASGKRSPCESGPGIRQPERTFGDRCGSGVPAGRPRQRLFGRPVRASAREMAAARARVVVQQVAWAPAQRLQRCVHRASRLPQPPAATAARRPIRATSPGTIDLKRRAELEGQTAVFETSTDHVPACRDERALSRRFRRTFFRASAGVCQLRTAAGLPAQPPPRANR